MQICTFEFFVTIWLCSLVTMTQAFDLNLCPINCSCSYSCESHDCLIINCQKRSTPSSIQVTSLSSDIDVLLSQMSNLTLLEISYSTLESVPMSVCRETRLKTIRMNFNQLKLLPDDCFVHMTDLVVFEAKFNRLKYLQVWDNTRDKYLKIKSIRHYLYLGQITSWLVLEATQRMVKICKLLYCWLIVMIKFS